MAMVTFTSSMSANSKTSSSDSSQFKTSSADSDTSTLYQPPTSSSSSSSSSTGVSNSDFSKIESEGPNMDVAFYCASSTDTDTSGQLSVTKLDITSFSGETLDFSINCPNSFTMSGSQSEVCSFVDSTTGQNSVTDCSISSDGTTMQSKHNTSFSYSIATFSSASDWWTRIYANYVLYLLIVIDFYFVAVFIFGLIMKRKNKPMKFMDTTTVNVLPIETKGQHLEHSSSFDKNSVHSNPITPGLHTKGFCKRFWTGFVLKYRLITPFTTEHEELSRIARGVINIIVLLLMWTFSGIINYGLNNNLAGAYCVSILICFIVARLFAFLLELVLKSRGLIVVTILGYIIAFLFVFVTHLSIFLLTEYMGSEFYNWGLIVLTIYLIDLIIWELSSLVVQLFLAKRFAQNLENFAGKRKFISKLITPPLFRAFTEA